SNDGGGGTAELIMRPGRGHRSKLTGSTSFEAGAESATSSDSNKFYRWLIRYLTFENESSVPAWR
ncbi:MAG TPA: hypothetical protein VIQ51_06890, partial [Chryseosolibacter sp.]